FVPALVLVRVLPASWGGLVAAAAYVLVYVAASVAYRAWRRDDARVLAGLGERYPRLAAWGGSWAMRLAGGRAAPGAWCSGAACADRAASGRGPRGRGAADGQRGDAGA